MVRLVFEVQAGHMILDRRATFVGNPGAFW
jgi:hypothetical protein